jgi:hypothetical protein
VHGKVKGKSRKKGRRSGRARKTVEAVVGKRSKDETREGYLYGLLQWPFLLIVGTWILGLGVAYLATRLYIWLYEHFIAWRGTRDKLRRAMRATSSYDEWVAAAKRMDEFLGNEGWKEENEFAYYDSVTVRRVWEQMRKCRAKAERVEEKLGAVNGEGEGRDRKDVEDLKALIEACVKNNFVGVENPRLYSQTYYGTKNLVQNFVDEGKQFGILSLDVQLANVRLQSRRASGSSSTRSSLPRTRSGLYSKASTQTTAARPSACPAELPSPTTTSAWSRRSSKQTFYRTSSQAPAAAHW